MTPINGYQIPGAWHAAAFLDSPEDTFFERPSRLIVEWLQEDVERFYSSINPVKDGAFLFVKVVGVHLFARIAQVFATVQLCVTTLGMSVYFFISAPFNGNFIEDVLQGAFYMGAAPFALAIALIIDSALAVTSPLEGIYEATRVVFSR